MKNNIPENKDFYNNVKEIKLKWDGFDKIKAKQFFEACDYDKKMIKNIITHIIVPTLGSDSDILFWKDVLLEVEKLEEE